MRERDESRRLLGALAGVAVAAMLLASWLAAPTVVDAGPQLMEPAYYHLDRVIHGPTWPTNRRIGSVEILPLRGRIHFPVRQSNRCREIYEFNWSFDSEIERLEAGERFRVNADALLRSADCSGADPYFTINGNMDTASERMKTLGSVNEQVYKGISGGSQNIYLKGGQQRRGPREVWLETPRQIQYRTPYVWFGVMVRAPSPIAAELVNYEVIYLYRAQFSFR